MLKIELDKVVPGLIKAAGKDHPADVRKYALLGLSRLGEAARPAIPTVIECLADPNPTVATAAVRCLGKLELDLDVTLPAMLRAMHERNDPYFSENLAVTLGNMAEAARPALPELLQVLHDPDLNSTNNPNLAANEQLLRLAWDAVNRIAPETLGDTNSSAASHPPAMRFDSVERYGEARPH